MQGARVLLHVLAGGRVQQRLGGRSAGRPAVRPSLAAGGRHGGRLHALPPAGTAGGWPSGSGQRLLSWRRRAQTSGWRCRSRCCRACRRRTCSSSPAAGHGGGGSRRGERLWVLGVRVGAMGAQVRDAAHACKPSVWQPATHTHSCACVPAGQWNVRGSRWGGGRQGGGGGGKADDGGRAGAPSGCRAG